MKIMYVIVITVLVGNIILSYRTNSLRDRVMELELKIQIERIEHTRCKCKSKKGCD